MSTNPGEAGEYIHTRMVDPAVALKCNVIGEEP